VTVNPCKMLFMKKTRQERYTEELDRLAQILRESTKPRTASWLSRKLKCTRATAYNRLEALHQRDGKLVTIKVRDGNRGPLSIAFRVAAAPAVQAG